MPVSKDEVDAWFAANPDATAKDVAAVVQSIGGLDANAGLTDILASHYGVDTSEVQNFYKAYAPPVGALSQVATETTTGNTTGGSSSDTTGALSQVSNLATVTDGNTAADNTANSLDFSNTNLSGLQTLDGSALTGLNTVQTDGGAGSTVDTSAATTVGALDQANAAVTGNTAGTGATDVVQNLTSQILGQGFTDKWSGEGFGSTDANATDIARVLSTAGITDVKDFGLVTVPTDAGVTPIIEYRMENVNGEETRVPVVVGYIGPDGQPVDPSLVQTNTDTDGNITGYSARVGTTEVFGNKKTGQVLDGQYDRASVDKGIFSGTFAGKDSTHYGVAFRADGTPIFYTQQGESTSDMGIIAPVLALAQFIPVLAPFATAINATIAIDNGDVLGGLASLAGLGGYTDVATGLRVANAIDQGNMGALASTLLQNSSIASVAGSTMLTGSISLADAGNAFNVVNNLASGNYTGALSSLGTLTGSADLNTAGAALNLANAISTGNITNIANAASGLNNTINAANNLANTSIARTIASAATTGSEVTGSNAYIAAINAGATEQEALAVANAVTGAATVISGSGGSAVTGAGDNDDGTKGSTTITGATGNDTGAGVVVNKVADSGANLSTITGATGNDTITGATGATTVTGGVDTNFGDLAGAQAAATARNTVTIGNAEANDLTEAAALARVRDPSASSFTFGGKTYNMTASDSQMNAAVLADRLNVISSAPKFTDAYSQARELLGAGKTFAWNGKTYSTDTRDENASLAAASDQIRINNMAASTTAGGGRGSYLGYNSVEDAASKANLTTTKTSELLGYINSAPETGGYDALGNPIGGQTIDANADLSTTSGKIANGVANAMTTFFGGVANMPVAGVQAIGNLTSNVGGIIDLVSGGPTEAGNKLRNIANQVETFTSSISDPKIKTQQQAIGTAIDQAEGLSGKAAALFTSVYENPLGAANWVFTEGFEEVPGIGVALRVGRALGAGSAASKTGIYGTTIANDMIESGGAAYNDTYKEAIKTMSEADARIAARNSSLAAMAVTGITGGIVEGKILNKVIGKDSAGEFVEGSLQSGATQLALGQDVSLNKMLTQGVIETGIGKGASSTASGVTATNIDAGTASGTSGAATDLGTVGAVTPGGSSTSATTGTTNLGSVGAETPGGDVVTSTDLGSIGSVTPGGDVVVSDASTLAGTGATTISVADAQTVMGDLGLNVSNDTAVDLATKINNVTTQIGSGADASVVAGTTVTGAITAGASADAAVGSTVTAAVTAGGDASAVVGSSITAAVTAGADASTVVGSSVTAAVTAGGNASTVVGSAVTAATTAGANVDTTVASSVSSAIAAGANANTVVTAAADAAIAAGNNVTVATDANTTTVTNATTNTTTTVNNNTGVATTVDANTNVTTTVDANTNTTTTVDANTNVTTQTNVNANTNTTTTVTVDANTNTNTQTVVDANTNTTTSTTVDANTNTTTQTTTNANTQTTVNTNVNTNTQTTVVIDTKTGEIIKQTETVIPDGWTPPVIDTPVVPDGVTPTASTSTTPTTKTTPTAKLSKSGSGAALAGGVMGLPSGFDMDPAMLASRVTEGRIDPLARVREAQAELERDIMMSQIDPRLMSVMQQRMDPNQQSKQLDQDVGALAKMLRGDSPNPSAPDAPANEGKYYAYGAEDSIDDILGGKAANYKAGGFVEPLKASGGMVLPLLAKSGGALGKYNGREDFKGGKHVAGKGDGQSDDIPAWLADGEFVFPADVVSALGNGSTKAGTDKLYEMMHGIRDRARSKGPKDLPPPALKSALDYLKSSKRSSK